MASFNIIAQTSEDTVVTEYEPQARRSDGYQSEADLEREFIHILCNQGYTYLQIHSESELIANLRSRLEALNRLRFSDEEWERFLVGIVANPNDGIKEKTRKIQEDNIQVLKRDDGSSQNIALIDRKIPQNNSLQVINQYAVGKEDGASHDNRYDVTVLVNGLPLVHVELKRRGVAIREAFNQIDRYQRDSFWAGSGLFEYVQIFVISNGTHTKYYSNSTRSGAVDNAKAKGRGKNKTSNSFEFTSFWADAQNHAISDLVDFARTFFARHTILNVLTRYCVLTSDGTLMVMRPYQITATERILNRIEVSSNYKKFGTVEAGGYVWHTTGSGKTLTSFKTARLASRLPYIDKVLFVVDRKDLDYQTMKEYDRFEKGAANSNRSTAVLKRQLESPDAKIIITTIQKLSTFVKKNPSHPVYQDHVVIIFDECHRSQFGEMHHAIVKSFRRYHIFGFTGTPIFASNTEALRSPHFLTTEQTFGDRLHSYTIVDAINDRNVLPFKVDYVRTMSIDEDVDDEKVQDIDREKALMAPERIELITRYILEHFNQKTYRGSSSYQFDTLTNITDVASAERGKVEEVRRRQRLSGFNSIFCVSSIEAARLYYDEFKRQMEADPSKRLRVATIFSYGSNDPAERADFTVGSLDEENSDDASLLDQSSRDFLEGAIDDYNRMFNTNYSTDGERFQSYYKDVSLRMKNRELDILIVVNMFLTGFDATTLNTLWVDKNLKMHGLIQAFSRTNRILNSVKTYGNIVCFRGLQKRVDEAIALFGDKDAGGIVLLRTFLDYYQGFTDDKGRKHPGYVEMVDELVRKFPVEEANIAGEARQREFISLFGAVLRMRNLLSTFDEFEGKGIIPERDFQDYLGKYQDLKDEWRPRGREKEDITDDVVFETELIRQVEIGIDYILALIEKYHEGHLRDKEVLISIQKAINASPDLRSKKELIENFIARLDGGADPAVSWQEYVDAERERRLKTIILEEKLNEQLTRKFMENAFLEGEVRTTGTGIDSLLPPMSRFVRSSEGNTRAQKKENVIGRLRAFLEEFIGIGSPFHAEESTETPVEEGRLPFD